MNLMPGKGSHDPVLHSVLLRSWQERMLAWVALQVQGRAGDSRDESYCMLWSNWTRVSDDNRNDQASITIVKMERIYYRK